MGLGLPAIAQEKSDNRLKYIAIFIFLANIAYFSWSISDFASDIEVQGREQRPLLNNGMTLLSEYEVQAQAIDETAIISQKMCLVTSQINNLEEALLVSQLATSNGLEASLLLLGEVLAPQYRVFLPPASSRAVATIMLDSLSEQAAEAELPIESYLITRGSLTNGIALGVFESLDNAQAVHAATLQLGYSPEIQEIPRSEGGFALRLEASGAIGLESPEWLDLAMESPNIEATENLCETIAQGEQFP